MKICKIAIFLLAVLLLIGCDRSNLKATLVAKEARGFHVELPSGQRYVCLAPTGVTPWLDAVQPGGEVILSPWFFDRCVPWQGTTSGNITGSSYTQPQSDGKQYVSRFVIESGGREYACPVDVEREKIPTPEGFAVYFGEVVTREGCTLL